MHYCSDVNHEFITVRSRVSLSYREGECYDTAVVVTLMLVYEAGLCKVVVLTRLHVSRPLILHFTRYIIYFPVLARSV